jgi:transcriptional regulator with XRE-family HTH domain
MKVSRLVRAARKRKGLTQRELAVKTRIPQPMISLIERGLQDPRYSTLERIFQACDLEMDVVNVAGGESIARSSCRPCRSLRKSASGGRLSQHEPSMSW